MERPTRPGGGGRRGYGSLSGMGMGMGSPPQPMQRSLRDARGQLDRTVANMWKLWDSKFNTLNSALLESFEAMCTNLSAQHTKQQELEANLRQQVTDGKTLGEGQAGELRVATKNNNQNIYGILEQIKQLLEVYKTQIHETHAETVQTMVNISNSSLDAAGDAMSEMRGELQESHIMIKQLEQGKSALQRKLVDKETSLMHGHEEAARLSQRVTDLESSLASKSAELIKEADKGRDLRAQVDQLESYMDDLQKQSSRESTHARRYKLDNEKLSKQIEELEIMLEQQDAPVPSLDGAAKPKGKAKYAQGRPGGMYWAPTTALYLSRAADSLEQEAHMVISSTTAGAQAAPVGQTKGSRAARTSVSSRSQMRPMSILSITSAMFSRGSGGGTTSRPGSARQSRTLADEFDLEQSSPSIPSASFASKLPPLPFPSPPPVQPAEPSPGPHPRSARSWRSSAQPLASPPPPPPEGPQAPARPQPDQPTPAPSRPSLSPEDLADRRKLMMISTRIGSKMAEVTKAEVSEYVARRRTQWDGLDPVMDPELDSEAERALGAQERCGDVWQGPNPLMNPFLEDELGMEPRPSQIPDQAATQAASRVSTPSSPSDGSSSVPQPGSRSNTVSRESSHPSETTMRPSDAGLPVSPSPYDAAAPALSPTGRSDASSTDPAPPLAPRSLEKLSGQLVSLQRLGSQSLGNIPERDRTSATRLERVHMFTEVVDSLLSLVEQSTNNVSKVFCSGLYVASTQNRPFVGDDATLKAASLELLRLVQSARKRHVNLDAALQKLGAGLEEFPFRTPEEEEMHRDALAATKRLEQRFAAIMLSAKHWMRMLQTLQARTLSPDHHGSALSAYDDILANHEARFKAADEAIIQNVQAQVDLPGELAAAQAELASLAPTDTDRQAQIHAELAETQQRLDKTMAEFNQVEQVALEAKQARDRVLEEMDLLSAYPDMPAPPPVADGPDEEFPDANQPFLASAQLAKTAAEFNEALRTLDAANDNWIKMIEENSELRARLGRKEEDINALLERRQSATYHLDMSRQRLQASEMELQRLQGQYATASAELANLGGRVRRLSARRRSLLSNMPPEELPDVSNDPNDPANWSGQGQIDSLIDEAGQSQRQAKAKVDELERQMTEQDMGLARVRAASDNAALEQDLITTRMEVARLDNALALANDQLDEARQAATRLEHDMQLLEKEAEHHKQTSDDMRERYKRSDRQAKADVADLEEKCAAARAQVGQLEEIINSDPLHRLTNTVLGMKAQIANEVRDARGPAGPTERGGDGRRPGPRCCLATTVHAADGVNDDSISCPTHQVTVAIPEADEPLVVGLYTSVREFLFDQFRAWGTVISWAASTAEQLVAAPVLFFLSWVFFALRAVLAFAGVCSAPDAPPPPPEPAQVLSGIWARRPRRKWVTTLFVHVVVYIALQTWIACQLERQVWMAGIVAPAGADSRMARRIQALTLDAARDDHAEWVLVPGVDARYVYGFAELTATLIVTVVWRCVTLSVGYVLMVVSWVFKFAVGGVPNTAWLAVRALVLGWGGDEAAADMERRWALITTTAWQGIAVPAGFLLQVFWFIVGGVPRTAWDAFKIHVLRWGGQAVDDTVAASVLMATWQGIAVTARFIAQTFWFLVGGLPLTAWDVFKVYVLRWERGAVDEDVVRRAAIVKEVMWQVVALPAEYVWRVVCFVVGGVPRTVWEVFKVYVLRME